VADPRGWCDDVDGVHRSCHRVLPQRCHRCVRLLHL